VLNNQCNNSIGIIWYWFCELNFKN